MINEKFKPKNPLIQEPVSYFGYFLNIDCLNAKRKALDMWKVAMILNLIYEPIYADDDRDLNAIYKLIINSFQGIVANWFNGIFPGIRNSIELDVKSNLVISIEGVWSMVKYLIGQFEGYEYVENQDNARIERRREALYN